MRFIKTLLIVSAAGLMSGCVDDGMMMGYSGHGGYTTSTTTASNYNSGYSSHHGNAQQGHQSGGYQGHANAGPQHKRWRSVARTNSPPVGYQGALANSSTSSGAYTYSGNASSSAGYSGR